MPGQRICSIYTPVLAAGTTKTHHETFETAFDIIFHGNVHQVKYTVEVFRHFGFLLQKILYFLVAAGFDPENFLSSRIQNTTAIENESTAIFRGIFGNSF